MSDFYTELSADPSPILLADTKNWLKIPPTMTADDDLIQVLIDACTQWGERYTGRDFRIKSWSLQTDCLTDRNPVCRSLVTAINSIDYLKDGIPTTINATTYYLHQRRWGSDVVLAAGESWPTDVDDIDHAYTIVFATAPIVDVAALKIALYKHVAECYTSRGDCKSAATHCGVKSIYDQIKITRI